ncbi:MAG: hypothetical protein HYY14_03895 [Candidatus Omnitrophica bacterium]|nr:hypothetical protein [Candidatus Omnitrophota bacterium]
MALSFGKKTSWPFLAYSKNEGGSTFSDAAFGSLLEKTGSADTSFRFTSRDWDAESGLYHLRARGYDARVGRFLQQDPWPRTQNWRCRRNLCAMESG